MHTTIKPGEALILSKLVELDIFTKFDDETNSSNVYRIKRLMGFTEAMSGMPRLLPIMDDNPSADIVILDDEDNGFNFSKNFWPLALKSTETSPIILYKMNNPIDSSELWKHLQKSHNEKTIVIINGDDLRSKGVNISKSLTWERTAQDFVWQISNNPNLAFLASAIVTGSQDNEELYESIGTGIRQEIVSAQKYFVEGFGENIEKYS